MALGINVDFIGGDAKEATEEYDCIDTTRGVFKAYAFFFQIVSLLLIISCNHDE